MIRQTKRKRRKELLKAMLSHRRTGRLIASVLRNKTALQIARALGIPLTKARDLKMSVDSVRARDAALGNLIDSIRVETTED